MVFSMQGFGTLLCSIVLILSTHSFIKEETQWRFVLAMGGFPMLIAFYFRWKMHETEWKTEKAPEASQRENDDAALMNKTDLPKQTLYENFLRAVEIVMQNKMKLLGTAGTWFLLDIVFYANGLFSGEVSGAIGGIKTPKGESVSSFILNILALPGYIFTVFYCDRIGLKRLQEYGFLAILFLFLLLALLHVELKKVRK